MKDNLKISSSVEVPEGATHWYLREKRWYKIIGNQVYGWIGAWSHFGQAEELSPYMIPVVLLPGQTPLSACHAASLPDDLRAKGLTVAVHNDYKLNGESYTFWLFTDASGMSYKGEGRTDAEALDEVRCQLSFGPLSGGRRSTSGEETK